MKRVKVRWEVTEVHEAVIEVPDDFNDDNVDEHLSSETLAEHEDGPSYHHTRHRDWIDWTVEK